jgi:adenylate kinase family enzyme
VRRFHVIGGSGSGTTTVGRALAERLDAVHVDADDALWEPSVPPYRAMRPRDVRANLLAEACAGPAWVLSGSTVGWGDCVAPRTDLVVWLRLPPEIRLARLVARERVRFGDAIGPGGSQEETFRAFYEWAARYDAGDERVRSVRQHERWLERHRLPFVQLDATRGVADLVEDVLRQVTSSS